MHDENAAQSEVLRHRPEESAAAAAAPVAIASNAIERAAHPVEHTQSPVEFHF